jgi:hypothetical protein
VSFSRLHHGGELSITSEAVFDEVATFDSYLRIEDCQEPDGAHQPADGSGTKPVSWTPNPRL